jgi:hypothetical protein
VIDKTHLFFEGAKKIFWEFICFYWELVLMGTCFFGVCSSLVKSNPSLGNLLLLGTCVGIVFFVCVVICLRAFSWELASVVDLFGGNLYA